MSFISRAKMLKRSWFSIADTPGCCCPYDASWCACKYWRTFYLSFRSKDIGISALFRIHVCNGSACCSSCWMSRCTADRSTSPYARLLGDSYGILKKKNKIEIEVNESIQNCEIYSVQSPHKFWTLTQNSEKTNFIVRFKKWNCNLSLLTYIL